MARRGRRPTSPSPTSLPAASKSPTGSRAAPAADTPAGTAPDAATPPPSRRFRVAVAAAGLVGLLLWVLAGNDLSPARWAVVLAAFGLSLVPPVTRAAAAVLDRLRNPSARAAEWTALLVGVIATAYLILTAFVQERPLAPRMFDESSYAIGAQLMARGRLWMPAHPLADFFDSFFLVARPVYGSIYFPGTALALAPGAALGSGSWIGPVLIAGLAVGLLYRVVARATGDGAAGLLAALWAVSLMPFRALSVMTMSHGVMLLLGLGVVWAWLRWRARHDAPRQWAWAAAVGALAGWAAITRPVDALAYAVPVGLAMAAGLWHRRAPARRWMTTATALVLGAAPFLALQVVQNVGVTGDPLRTPYTDYLAREQPGAQFGVRAYDPARKPTSASPQVQGYYEWCRPWLEQHQLHNFLAPWFVGRRVRGTVVELPRLLNLADATLPSHALLLFLPVGLVALATGAARRRRQGSSAAPATATGPPAATGVPMAAALPLAASLPLFVLLYALNPFFLPHYGVVVVPAVVLLALLGVEATARAAGGRWARPARVAATALVLAVALTSLWEFKLLTAPAGLRPTRDGFQEAAPQTFVQTAIDLTATPPAVVLFGPPPELWTEMVYNVDVAWPDDAPIVRARDLGPRNAELVDYYGRVQPERTIYKFDWGRGSLQMIGRAGPLREQMLRARGGGEAATQPAVR